MKISKITILTGILLFFSLTILAQNEFSVKEKNEIERYEQLIEKYKQQNNKRLQAQYLNKLAYIYWKKYKNNKALSYFEQSIALNKAINNANALYTLHNNSGMIYTDLEQDQKALDMFQESLKYAEKMKEEGYDTEIIKAKNNFNMVSIGAYETMPLAARKLTSIREGGRYQVWIYENK